MASRTSSVSDVFYSEGDVLSRIQDPYSPMSNSSMRSSQDMNSVFDHSEYDRGCQYDDYSHINFPPSRKMSMQTAPEPPLRTSSVQSFSSDYTHRSYTTGHGHTYQPGGQSGHYYKSIITQQQQHYSQQNNQNVNVHPRRRTWTPSGLKIPPGINGNISNGNSVRNCHSNDMFENNLDNLHIGSSGHISGDSGSDIAPPRLAPVSGILPRSPARGLIKPIAFKPVVVNQNYVNTRRMVDNRKHSVQQDDGYGSQDYPMTNRNAADTSHGSIQMDSDRSASFSSDGQSVKQFSPDRPDSIRSFQMDSDHSHSTSFSSDSQKQFSSTPERSESIPSSNMSRISSNRIEGYVQTPSPSDSGVGELEAMLKEKDAEINTLREVMDKNERAIFQVYEDKKSSWTREMQELKEDYEQKLKILQRKNYKTEQVMSLQVFKLQQEKKTAKEEYDKLRAENEDLKLKVNAYAQETERLESHIANVSINSRSVSDDEVTDLQLTVESLNDSLALKTRESNQLKSELENKNKELETKNSQIEEKFKEIKTKAEEVETLKASLRKMSSDIDLDLDLSHCLYEIDQCKSPITCDRLKSPNTSSSSIAFSSSPSPRSQGSPRSLVSPSLDKDKQITLLQEQVSKLREEVSAHKDTFEKERDQWVDEKNKVIRYQKQLQLNYVQMYRKNKLLEAEVEQLTLELESRDIKLMALSGEESVC